MLFVSSWETREREYTYLWKEDVEEIGYFIAVLLSFSCPLGSGFR